MRLRLLTPILLFPLLQACGTPYVRPEEMASLPPLSPVQAKKVLREKARATLNDYASIERVDFDPDGVRLLFRVTGSRTESCKHPYTSKPITVIYSQHGTHDYTLDNPSICECCHVAWADGEDAKAYAHALMSLSSAAARGGAPSQDELAEFKARVPELRPRAREPLTEDARRYRVQAEDAVRERRFEDAADLYQKALEAAPWWADGYFNRALVLGELQAYSDAIGAMRRYLLLAPDAPDARDAQDRVYSWEAKAR